MNNYLNVQVVKTMDEYRILKVIINSKHELTIIGDLYCSYEIFIKL